MEVMVRAGQEFIGALAIEDDLNVSGGQLHDVPLGEGAGSGAGFIVIPTEAVDKIDVLAGLGGDVMGVGMVVVGGGAGVMAFGEFFFVVFGGEGF